VACRPWRPRVYGPGERYDGAPVHLVQFIEEAGVGQRYSYLAHDLARPEQVAPAELWFLYGAEADHAGELLLNDQGKEQEGRASGVDQWLKIPGYSVIRSETRAS
jgi:hypothetical protein